MDEFMLRFRFHLHDWRSADMARKEFGSLLRKLNLRYRSELNYLDYIDISLPDARPWELDFLMLPTRYQPHTCWENLRLLMQSYLKPFQAAHPEWGGVSMYRNLDAFPDLIHTTADWWK